MSVDTGRVCRLCLTETKYMLPLFNEDAVLPTRIMMVVPVVKVCVWFVVKICVLRSVFFPLPTWTGVVGLFGDGMSTAAGSGCGESCRFRRL